MMPELREIRYQYKCRFCGEVFTDSTEHETETKAQVRLLEIVDKPDRNMITSIHDCSLPGQTGIADLVGFTSSPLP